MLKKQNLLEKFLQLNKYTGSTHNSKFIHSEPCDAKETTKTYNKKSVLSDLIILHEKYYYI